MFEVCIELYFGFIGYGIEIVWADLEPGKGRRQFRDPALNQARINRTTN